MKRFKRKHEFLDREFRFRTMPNTRAEFGRDAQGPETFYVGGVDVVAVG